MLFLFSIIEHPISLSIKYIVYLINNNTLISDAKLESNKYSHLLSMKSIYRSLDHKRTEHHYKQRVAPDFTPLWQLLLYEWCTKQ